MRSPSKQQFSGCLVGQCLGDALGARREGFPREDCEDYVAGPMQSWLAGEEPDGELGQYTDDSQLARELMQSCVACGKFDPADYATRVAAIVVEDRIVGRGMATHHAAMRLAAGMPWEEAGAPPPSAICQKSEGASWACVQLGDASERQKRAETVRAKRLRFVMGPAYSRCGVPGMGRMAHSVPAGSR